MARAPRPTKSSLLEGFAQVLENTPPFMKPFVFLFHARGLCADAPRIARTPTTRDARERTTAPAFEDSTACSS
jgi:hypothetical protein